MLEEKKPRRSRQQASLVLVHPKTSKTANGAKNSATSNNGQMSSSGNTINPQGLSLLSKRCVPCPTPASLTSPLLGELPGTSLLIGQQAASLQLAHLKAQLALTQINSAIAAGSRAATNPANSNTLARYIPSAPPSPTAVAINLLNLLKIANTMSHPMYNPYTSGNQTSTQGQYGLPSTQAERDPRITSSGPGAWSSVISDKSGQVLQSSMPQSGNYRPAQNRTMMGEEIERSVDMHLSRARETAKLQGKLMHRPIDQDTRFTGRERDTSHSLGSRMVSYPVSSTSAPLAERHSDVQSDSTSLDWLSNLNADKRFTDSGERHASIPGLGDYDSPVPDKPTAPAESSQSRHTSESAAAILLRFGLDKEDLDYLLEYPEDQINPANLPIILRQIRIQKAKKTTTADQSRHYHEPQHTRGASAMDSHSISSSGNTKTVQEQESSSIVQSSKVIEYGHTSKYARSVGDEIRMACDSRPTNGGNMFALDNSRTNQELLSKTATVKSSVMGSSREKAGSLVNKDPDIRMLMSKTSEPAAHLPCTPLRNTAPSQSGLVVMDGKDIVGSKGQSKTQGQGSAVAEQIKRQTTQQQMHKQPVGQQSEPQPVQPMSQMGPVMWPPVFSAATSGPKPWLPMVFPPAVPTSIPPPMNFGHMMPSTSTRPPAEKVTVLKGLPAPAKMYDYAAASPRIFPHTCSLCNKECTDMKDWLLHQNASSHLENCRLLRKQYPDWDGEIGLRPRDVGKDLKPHTKISTDRYHKPRHGRSSRSRSSSPRRHHGSEGKREKRSSRSRSPRSSRYSRRSPDRRSPTRRRNVSPSPPRRSHEGRLSTEDSPFQQRPNSSDRLAKKGLESSAVHSLPKKSNLQTAFLSNLAKTSPSSSFSTSKANLQRNEASSSLSGKSSPPTMVRLQGINNSLSHSDVITAVEHFGKTKSIVLFRAKNQGIVCFEKEEDAKKLKSVKSLNIKGLEVAVGREKETVSKETTKPHQKTPVTPSVSTPQTLKGTTAMKTTLLPTPGQPPTRIGAAQSAVLVPKAASVPIKGEEKIPEKQSGAEKGDTSVEESVLVLKDATTEDVQAAKETLVESKLHENAKPTQLEQIGESGKADQSQPTLGVSGHSADKPSPERAQKQVVQEDSAVSEQQPAASQPTLTDAARLPIEEILQKNLCITKIASFKRKIFFGQNFFRLDKKQLIITGFPPYTDGLYTEEDIVNLLKPYGFRYNPTNIYVVRESGFAFVRMSEPGDVRNVMNAFGKDQCLFKGSALHFRVLGRDISLAPLQFYRYLMNLVDISVSVNESRLLFISDISPSQSRHLTETLKKLPMVRNYLPLLNKIFVEFDSAHNAEIWLNNLKQNTKHQVQWLTVEKHRMSLRSANRESAAPEPNAAEVDCEEPGASATPDSDVTVGEMVQEYVTPESIVCFNRKHVMTPQYCLHGRKQVVIKKLPLYTDGCYTEEDIAKLLKPFGFEYAENKINIVPQLCIALVVMPTGQSVQNLMSSYKKGVLFKGRRIFFQVAVGGIAMDPLGFYRSLMKLAKFTVQDDGRNIVLIKNISQSQTQDLREELRKYSPVRNFLPLFNKVFVEFAFSEDADRLGVWYSLLKQAPAYEFHRLKEPRTRFTTEPPKSPEKALPDSQDAVAGATIPVTKFGVPDGSFAPFWIPMRTSPFLFPTGSPWFLIPDFLTVKQEEDINTARKRGCVSTIMLTGLPEGNYTQDDIAGLVRPYFTKMDVHSLYYKVMVLTLQRRAFVFFPDWNACSRFARDHIRNPVSVTGSVLHVHFVFEDMSPDSSEELMYRNLMRWSNSGIPELESLDDRLLCVETSETSPDLVKAVMEVVSTFATFVGFLPLANRICIEMANSSEATKIIEASQSLPDIFENCQIWSQVKRFETAKNLKLRLFNCIETPVNPEPACSKTPVNPEPASSKTPVNLEPDCNKAPVNAEPDCSKTPVNPEPACSKTPVNPEPACSKTPVNPEPASSKTPVNLEPDCNKAPVNAEPDCSKTPVNPEPACSKTPVNPEPACSKTPVNPEPDCNKAPVNPEPECSQTPVNPEPECSQTPVNPEPACSKTPVNPEPACSKTPVNPEPACSKTPVNPEPACNKAPVNPELACSKKTAVNPEPDCSKTPVNPEPACSKTPVNPEPDCNKTPVNPKPDCTKAPVNPKLACSKKTAVRPRPHAINVKARPVWSNQQRLKSLRQFSVQAEVDFTEDTLSSSCSNHYFSFDAICKYGGDARLSESKLTKHSKSFKQNRKTHQKEEEYPRKRPECTSLSSPPHEAAVPVPDHKGSAEGAAAEMVSENGSEAKINSSSEMIVPPQGCEDVDEQRKSKDAKEEEQEILDSLNETITQTNEQMDEGSSENQLPGPEEGQTVPQENCPVLDGTGDEVQAQPEEGREMETDVSLQVLDAVSPENQAAAGPDDDHLNQEEVSVKDLVNGSGDPAGEDPETKKEESQVSPPEGEEDQMTTREKDEVLSPASSNTSKDTENPDHQILKVAQADQDQDPKDSTKETEREETFEVLDSTEDQMTAEDGMKLETPSAGDEPTEEEEDTFEVIDSLDDQPESRTDNKRKRTKKEETTPRRPSRRSSSTTFKSEDTEKSPKKQDSTVKKHQTRSKAKTTEEMVYKIVDSVEEELVPDVSERSTRRRSARGKKDPIPPKPQETSERVVEDEEATYKILDSVEDETPTRSTRGRRGRPSKKDAVKTEEDPGTRRKRSPAEESQETTVMEEEKAPKQKSPAEKRDAQREDPREELDSVEDQREDHQPASRGRGRRGRPRKVVRATKKDQTPKKDEDAEASGNVADEEEVTFQVLDSVEEDPADDPPSTGGSERVSEDKQPEKGRSLEGSSRNQEEEEEEPMYQILDSVEDDPEENLHQTPASEEASALRADPPAGGATVTAEESGGKVTVKEEESEPVLQDPSAAKESGSGNQDEKTDNDDGDASSAQKSAILNLEKVSSDEEEEEEEEEVKELVTLDEVGADDEDVTEEEEQVLITLDEFIDEEEGGRKEEQLPPERKHEDESRDSFNPETLVTVDETSADEDEKPNEERDEKTQISMKRKHDDDADESTNFVTVDEVGGDEEEEEKEKEEEVVTPRTKGRAKKRSRQTPVRKSTRGKRASAAAAAEEEEERQEVVLQASSSSSDPPSSLGSEQPDVQRQEAASEGNATNAASNIQQLQRAAGRSRAELKADSKQRRDEAVAEDQVKRSRSQSPSVANDFLLPPFRPDNPLGQEFVVPKSGFFCNLCNIFYLSKSVARERHCSSQKHYDNLQKHYEKLQQRRSRASTQSAGGSLSG
ncbi:uncharacterized protein V6R79_006289 [Siganus canaliculatus]